MDSLPTEGRVLSVRGMWCAQLGFGKFVFSMTQESWWEFVILGPCDLGHPPVLSVLAWLSPPHQLAHSDGDG